MKIRTILVVHGWIFIALFVSIGIVATRKKLVQIADWSNLKTVFDSFPGLDRSEFDPFYLSIRFTSRSV